MEDRVEHHAPDYIKWVMLGALAAAGAIVWLCRMFSGLNKPDQPVPPTEEKKA